MSLLGIRVRWDLLRILEYNVITDAYIGVGDALTYPAWILTIKNLTDQELYGSTDGINDYFELAAGEVKTLDLVANRSKGQGFFMAQGDRIYVRAPGTEPSQGNVYVEVIYASDVNT